MRKFNFKIGLMAAIFTCIIFAYKNLIDDKMNKADDKRTCVRK